MIEIVLICFVLMGVGGIILCLARRADPVEGPLADVPLCCGVPLLERWTGRDCDGCYGMKCRLCQRVSRWGSYFIYQHERSHAIRCHGWNEPTPGWIFMRGEDGKTLCRHEDELRDAGVSHG